jgi:hypothetical protein
VSAWRFRSSMMSRRTSPVARSCASSNTVVRRSQGSFYRVNGVRISNLLVASAGPADRAHMSPSTFRQHFRTLIDVSPLHYQKQLRLQEARQLMLNENLHAGSAAGRVGYESASQFSREYKPPVRCAASARCHAHAARSRGPCV